MPRPRPKGRKRSSLGGCDLAGAPCLLAMDPQNSSCVPACRTCGDSSRDPCPSFIPPQIYDLVRITTEGSCASSPPLPSVISVKECILRRSVSRGWGFTLRGTKSGCGKDKWIYNCFVESISEDGSADVSPQQRSIPHCHLHNCPS